MLKKCYRIIGQARKKSCEIFVLKRRKVGEKWQKWYMQ